MAEPVEEQVHLGHDDLLVSHLERRCQRRRGFGEIGREGRTVVVAVVVPGRRDEQGAAAPPPQGELDLRQQGHRLPSGIPPRSARCLLAELVCCGLWAESIMDPSLSFLLTSSSSMDGRSMMDLSL